MDLIVDSSMAFPEAVKGSVAPDNIINSLRLLDVQYWGFDKKLHQGQIVVYYAHANDIKQIFNELLKIKYPIEKMLPIVAYGWDDHASIRDNNTSAFNYRKVFGTDKVSAHSYGWAIDINPRINPYITEAGEVQPHGPAYDPLAPGAIVDGGPVVTLFAERGWQWGGHWRKDYGYVDYQHFYKSVP